MPSSPQTLQIVRPRRSCLFMPGSNARAIAKAVTLPCDAVVLDLEDAVAPDAKPLARAGVCQALAEQDFGQRERVIRVNALGTPWGADDLVAVARSGADGVLVPKVNGPQDVAAIDAQLSQAGAPSDLALWVMIETPPAVLSIREIAAASRQSRLTTLVMGTNDLAKDMRAESTPDRLAFLTALSITVMAGRAEGLCVIDGVFNAIDDNAGLEAECRQGRTLGFDGKSAIHPAQLEICNRIFAPAADAIAQAEAVIAAFADPANAGRAVIQVNGKMTELLHLEEALRLVALKRAIAALAN